MKKQAFTMIALIVLVGSMAVAAQAQSSTRLVANIPFEFNVGNQKLPAGKYIVGVREFGSRILQISCIDSHDRAVLLMIPATNNVQDHARLVFNRYGDSYFFAQAWNAGERTGMQAVKSRAERNLVRELAGVKPQTKAIALTTHQ